MGHRASEDRGQKAVVRDQRSEVKGQSHRRLEPSPEWETRGEEVAVPKEGRS